MVYVILLISGLGLFYARKFRECYERFFNIKIFLYWLLSIITMTIAGSIPLPLGLAVAIIIYLNTKINKRPKLYSILCGTAGYILSVLVFLIFR